MDIGQVGDLCLEIASALDAYVIAFDYPGYGIMRGTPSREGINSTGARVLDHVMDG